MGGSEGGGTPGPFSKDRDPPYSPPAGLFAPSPARAGRPSLDIPGRMRLHDPVYSRALRDPALIACPHCDLLQRLPALAPGASARCPRCDKELWRRREDSLNRTLALALAAAVLYVIANSVPMLGLSAVGHQASTTVIGGAQQLWHDGREIVAVLVLFTAVVAPALQIGFMLAIVLGARRPRAAALGGHAAAPPSDDRASGA